MTKAPEQDPQTGRFLPGNSGNGGRKKGSRNKLGEQFITDMLADWEEHGPAAIVQVREEKPDAYLKVIASILPKELNVNVSPLEEMTDDQLRDQLRRLTEELGPFLAFADGGAASGSEDETRH